MTSVSIIGTGNMGSAIGAVVQKGGADLQVVDRDADKAAALASKLGGTPATFGDALTGDVVVLAVPYSALDEIISTYRHQFPGKIVVDLTNPVDFDTFDGMIIAADTSAAVQIAQAVPEARVVKAFNTNFAATLASGEVGGVPTSVLVAGDDEAAKATLSQVVAAGGLQTRDAGSLKRARELEALGFLQIVLAVREQVAWSGGFAVRA